MFKFIILVRHKIEIYKLKKINIWRFMLFEFIIIRETSEKIWEQAKKVDSEEAVRVICLAASNYVCIDF